VLTYIRMQVGRRPAVVSPLELRESLRVFAAARAAPLAFVGLATARTAPHKHTHLKQQPCALRDGRRRGGHAGQAGNPGHYVALVVLRVSQGEARRDCDAHWHAAMGSLLFSGSISMDHGRGQAAFLESSCSCMGMARTDDNMDGSNAWHGKFRRVEDGPTERDAEYQDGYLSYNSSTKHGLKSLNHSWDHPWTPLYL
jgi:hypothetical protein